MQAPTDWLGRILIAMGFVLVVVGLLLVWGRFPRLGSLPGDIVWSGRGWTVAIPIATSLLLSVLLTIALNLVLRRR